MDQGSSNGKREVWVVSKILGKGGFGSVSLYENKSTGQKMAVKQCVNEHLHNDKLKERWKQEVLLLHRMDHDGIVKTYSLPPELRIHSPLPVLCMEYCPGGDLRKLLLQPENCCGLRELQVRQLLQDIAGAVEYLHMQNVTHRDLKPENVVLNPLPDRVYYKLVDLGYAKDVEESVCQSFVGTMQYLAPELFVNQPYTNTVDLWSLGVLIFEAITGYRPFFHSLSPAQCYTVVEKKSDKEICGFFNARNEKEFTSTFPSRTHLCSVTSDLLIQWLREVLIWNPDRRGNGMHVNRRMNCFVSLDDYLQRKIVHVLNVSTMKLHSFPVPMDVETITVKFLQQQIADELKVDETQQELMLSTGVKLNSTQPIRTCLSDLQTTELDTLVFLFHTNTSHFAEAQDIANYSMPGRLREVLRNPFSIQDTQEQKKVWRQAVLFCNEQLLTVQRLHQAHKAILLNLSRQTKLLTKLSEKANSRMQRMNSFCEFLSQMVSFDVDQCHKHKPEVAYNMMKSSKSVEIMENDLQALENGIMKAEADRRVVEAKICEVQKTCGTRKDKPFIDFEKEAKRLFESFKQAEVTDNRVICRLVKDCLEAGVQYIGDVLLIIKKVNKCRGEIETVIPLIQHCIRRLDDWESRTKSLQRTHQTNLWETLASDQASKNGVSINVPNQTTRENTRDQAAAASGESLESGRLVSMVTESLRDSHVLQQTTRQNLQQMKELRESVYRVKDTPVEDDWLFLEQSPK